MAFARFPTIAIIYFTFGKFMLAIFFPNRKSVFFVYLFGIGGIKTVAASRQSRDLKEWLAREEKTLREKQVIGYILAGKLRIGVARILINLFINFFCNYIIIFALI